MLQLISVVGWCFLLWACLTGGQVQYLNGADTSVDSDCFSLDPPRPVNVALVPTAVIQWNISQSNRGCIPEEINVTCISQNTTPAVRLFSITQYTAGELQHTTINDLDQGVDYSCFGKLRRYFVESDRSEPRTVTVAIQNLTSTESKGSDVTDTTTVFETTTGDSGLTSTESKVNDTDTSTVYETTTGVSDLTSTYTDTITTSGTTTGKPDIGWLNVTVNSTGPNSATIYWKIIDSTVHLTNFSVSVKLEGVNWDYNSTACNFTYTAEYAVKDAMNYTFDQLIAYSNYTVLVTGYDDGFSLSGSTNMTTNESAPWKPANLNIEESENGTGIVHWETPCLMNGVGDRFDIEITGCYSYNKVCPVYAIIYNGSVNFLPNTFIYGVHIPPTIYSYNLKAKVKVVLKSNIEGLTAEEQFRTAAGIPGQPIITLVNKSAESFNISVEKPKEERGEITKYECIVTPVKPIHKNLACDYSNYTKEIIRTMSPHNKIHSFVALPYFSYNVSIRAFTEAGAGPPSFISFETNSKPPDNVRSLKYTVFEHISPADYSVRVCVEFEKACFINGDFETYEVIIHNINQSDTLKANTKSNYYDFFPTPDNVYDIRVQTITKNFENLSEAIFYRSPLAVPRMPQMNQVPTKNEGLGVSLTLRKDLFDSEYGNISYFALILADRNVTGGVYSRWNSTEWPRPSTNRSSFYYQITPDFFYPFEGGRTEFKFEVGEGKCGNTTCYNMVETERTYFLILRVMNAGYYVNSMPMAIQFDRKSYLVLILGLTIGLVVLVAVSILVFLIWKKKLPGFLKVCRWSSSIKPTQETTTRISYTNVPNYVAMLEENPNVYSKQYLQLSERTRKINTNHTTSAAILPVNKRKNRYQNILPFDKSRVKLLLDEDDEVNNDYINASYIAGYSGNNEYIATQGPLKSTCTAFWRMVLQENVKIIVMVAQFVETNIEKVCRYFPEYGSTMGFDDNITIECLSVVEFDAFCIRTLLVQRDEKSVMCTHLQYLQWPDFGVPHDTQSMLQFCYQMRQKVEFEGGPIIVHCSAGVGRTGTIIATDLLLQNLNAKKPIDVFNTVLDLRKQRVNMVQTEGQYIYIHRLLRDWILCPPTVVSEDNTILLKEMVSFPEQLQSSEVIEENGF